MKKIIYLLLILFTFVLVSCDDTATPDIETPDVETPGVTIPVETPTPDVSGVKFNSETFDYDGLPHSIYCVNVPGGVTVKYEGNEVVEVGVYEVVATLYDGDSKIVELKATITILETKLTTPVLSIDSFGVVSWDSVANATHYNYIINDGDVLSTTSLTISINDGESVSVQAANSDKVSEWSYSVCKMDTSDIYEQFKEKLYVKFHNTNLASLTVMTGDKVNRPVDPVKENYEFDNWYKDPFYSEVFDFDTKITHDTVIYANFIPSSLISDTYYWVKGSPLITADVMSSGTNSDWHYIPLKANENNTSFKEFCTTITISGATSTNPAAFIVMDGFSNDSGRTYWKNGDSDFFIYDDGVYNIYFSVEYEYSSKIHVYIEAATNSVSDPEYKVRQNELTTPVVNVNSETNVASWHSVKGATSYEVIVNNGEVITTKYLKVELPKGSFVTVRAISETSVSNWSIPKSNINVIIVGGDTENLCSVYFMGYDAYQVEINETVNNPLDPTLDGYTFGGWYTDINYIEKATFPYTINKNTVFYPKWDYEGDYTSKIYYNLVDEAGNVISGLTWNLDNFTYDEYQTESVSLSFGVTYYIESVSDSSVKYGPYTVKENGKYTIYFSEDYLWNNNSNVYIASNMRRIYFSDSKGWTDTIYAYVWGTGGNNGWPGVEMNYLENNEMGEEVYYIDLDLELYQNIIFSHGTNKVVVTQTVDIVLSDSVNGYYVTNKIDGKYEVGTYSR